MKIRNVDKLRQRLLNVSHSIEQRTVNAFTDPWRARLETFIRAED